MIVDSVLAIRKGLTDGHSTKLNPEPIANSHPAEPVRNIDTATMAF